MGWMAEARCLPYDIKRMIHQLGLHAACPDKSSNVIDVQMGIRIYWLAYAMDK